MILHQFIVKLISPVIKDKRPWLGLEFQDVTMMIRKNSGPRVHMSKKIKMVNVQAEESREFQILVKLERDIKNWVTLKRMLTNEKKMNRIDGMLFPASPKIHERIYNDYVSLMNEYSNCILSTSKSHLRFNQIARKYVDLQRSRQSALESECSDLVLIFCTV